MVNVKYWLENKVDTEYETKKEIDKEKKERRKNNMRSRRPLYQNYSIASTNL
jgi:hypothetical protein